MAGFLYLHKAAALDSLWDHEMGYHTAAWHALLTMALFPASMWGPARRDPRGAAHHRDMDPMRALPPLPARLHAAEGGARLPA